MILDLIWALNPTTGILTGKKKKRGRFVVRHRGESCEDGGRDCSYAALNQAICGTSRRYQERLISKAL